jgi:hypothetical protein
MIEQRGDYLKFFSSRMFYIARFNLDLTGGQLIWRDLSHCLQAFTGGAGWWAVVRLFIKTKFMRQTRG